MRALLLSCWAGLLLIGCESRPAATATTQAQPTGLVPKVTRVIAGRPTNSSTTTVFGHSYYGRFLAGERDTSSGPPRLIREGQTWRVRTAARADSAHPLAFKEAADKEHHWPATVEKGTDVHYTFQLLDSHGRLRFTRQLSKADFAKAVYGSLLTEAGAAAPNFLAYWPARRALVFEVGFGREDTDEGVFVLVLLDAATGQVQHIAAEKPYMSGCDCWPTLTPDGQTLLAGEEILRANGQVTVLTKDGRAVAGTRIITDSTFLVVYEGDELRNNAQLVSRTGRVEHQFTFHGTDRTMSSGGYSLAVAFLPATATNYLYDKESQTLTLIPLRKPITLQQTPVKRLARFQPPQRASEKKLEFEYNDLPSAALYVDTLTQQLRFANTKISYQ